MCYFFLRTQLSKQIADKMMWIILFIICQYFELFMCLLSIKYNSFHQNFFQVGENFVYSMSQEILN